MSATAAAPDLLVRRETTWASRLKCTICFSLFQEPHTLRCGHTFCRRCLVRLAELSRDQKPESHVSRVRAHCPTCRRSFSALPFLRSSAPVTYIIRDLVDSLKAESQQLSRLIHATAENRHCRSTGTQSCTSASTTSTIATASHHSISSDQRLDRPLRALTYLSTVLGLPDVEDSSSDKSDRPSCSNQPTHGDTQSASSSRSQTLDSSDSSGNVDSESERDLAPGGTGLGNVIRRLDRVPGLGEDSGGVLDLVVGDMRRIAFNMLWTSGRMVLVIFWFLYTVVVTIIAHNFLPYMLLYSLLFLLILYTESIQTQTRHR